MTSGYYNNKNSITNGPAAGYGLYVGTIRSNGSSTIDFILGGAAAGGTAAFLMVWNQYNQVNIAPAVYDSTASWTYATGAWRPSDNSTSNRITFVLGQAAFVEASFTNIIENAAGYSGFIGIGINSTTVQSGVGAWGGSSVVVDGTPSLSIGASFAIGLNYIQALENTSGHTCTFYGLYSPASDQVHGLSASLSM